ncbi:RNA pseudouridine synthase 3, mitochondrial [Glycine soja]|uniref:RNA pseudouridine synthase 3, mitochondrial n=1 Tax=Glycine soja TaxID=3848 RepID=A0A445GAW9_GLYSO|nr:RNA pseudouridine synthase 3, mitochondrial [Glycine soja]
MVKMKEKERKTVDSDDVFLPRPPPLHHAAYTHSNNSIALNPNSSLHLRRHSHNHASLKLVITLLDSLALISSSSSAVNVGGRRRRCGSYVVFLECEQGNGLAITHKVLWASGLAGSLPYGFLAGPNRLWLRGGGLAHLTALAMKSFMFFLFFFSGSRTFAFLLIVAVNMLNHVSNNNSCSWLLFVARHYSRIQPPRPVSVEPVISVSNNIARLDAPKEGPKPRQLLSLPPFPGHPLPDKSSISGSRQRDYVTAVNWIKYYFKGTWGSVIESHFREGLVQMEADDSSTQKEEQMKPMRKIRPNEVMKRGARVHVPVSICETRISKRYDAIPSGTLYPNADEIKYLQRLDSAIIVLNKPPKLPVKGSLPVHNSMDALAAAALSYDYDEGPKLVNYPSCKSLQRNNLVYT